MQFSLLRYDWRRTFLWCLFALMVVLYVVLLCAVLVAGGGWFGVLVWTYAFVLGVLLIGAVDGVSGRRSRARRCERAVSPLRPGWTFVPALSTPTLRNAMRAIGLRLTTGVECMLAYGPGGVEVWRLQKGQPICVAGHPWSSVQEVVATREVRSWRGSRVWGVRVVLAELHVEELQVMSVKQLGAEFPGLRPAETVAASMQMVRSAPSNTERLAE